MTGLRRTFLALAILVVAACGAASEAQPRRPAQTAEAVFAGGCFWSMERAFDHLDGVVETISGYTGGQLENPTYQDVITETTGHYESVRVVYDPARLTYAQVLHYYWRHVDPTDSEGQFCDRGPSYRTAVFVTPQQRAEAEASKTATESTLGRQVTTEILPLARFYPAESYHQNYAQRNPAHYNAYSLGCGRDRSIQAMWRGR